MTNKELRRLSRTALIDLLIEQTERNNELQAKIDKLERQVKNRTFTFSSPASIADAAAELNKMLSKPEQTPDGGTDMPAPRPEEARQQSARQGSWEVPVDWEAHLGAIRNSPPPAPPPPAEKSRPARTGASGSRASERTERAKKTESKASQPRRDERSARNARRDPVTDPFGSAPLDDNLNKAFNEMLRRNSR